MAPMGDKVQRIGSKNVPCITAMVLSISFAFAGCSQLQAVSVRDRLLENSGVQDEHFPDGKTVKLTHFAYLGTVESEQGPLHIVYMRAVLTGMLAPRGQSKIMVFDSSFDYQGSMGGMTVDSQPLWCEGPYVFLEGRTRSHWDKHGHGVNGNAIDLSRGFEHYTLVDIKEYGSSGGIEDEVPTAEQRRAWYYMDK